MIANNNITTENTIFVLLSFEGPDGYSLAGGLGVRITNMAQTLASKGFRTHLFFIGDPRKPSEEIASRGKLMLHRWCQWISHYYPNGVYHGENEKLYDFNKSLPWFVVDSIVKPAVARGKLVVVLGEEWHTVEAIYRISDLLYSLGLRQKVVMFWNANNTFGFDRINWGRLAYISTITTVSRYMKHVMWKMGINPLVIPNGIPESLLTNIDTSTTTELKKRLNAELTLTKVARWDPDKRWHMALAATAQLKAKGIRTVLLARGGMEPHGSAVMHYARSLGLNVRDVWAASNTLEDYVQSIGGCDGADVINIRFHCPLDFLRIIYHASDAVLANSGHEPFGLVGLEAMAVGGVAFTGGTGEDYAVSFYNAIVLETSQPGEITDYLLYLKNHPVKEKRIREAAKHTASRYTWNNVLNDLVYKLEYQARIQGSLNMPKKIPPPEPMPDQGVSIAPKQTLPSPEPETTLVGGA